MGGRLWNRFPRVRERLRMVKVAYFAPLVRLQSMDSCPKLAPPQLSLGTRHRLPAVARTRVSRGCRALLQGGLNLTWPSHDEHEASHVRPETSHAGLEASHLGSEASLARCETSHIGSEASHVGPEASHIRPEPSHIRSEAALKQRRAPHEWAGPLRLPGCGYRTGTSFWSRIGLPPIE